MVDRETLIEAGARGLIDVETNGLCGEAWPGPCDMCDCGLDGLTVAQAATGQSAAQDRARVAEVLRRVLPLIAEAIEAMPIPFTSDDERMAWGHAVRISVAEAVRSLGGSNSKVNTLEE